MQTTLARRMWWNYLIVDEGHALKNEGSQVSQGLRSFHAAHKLLLTGTPLQNNLHELWALLNFLNPDLFTSSDHFDQAFKLNGSVVMVKNDQLNDASRLLQPLMLRRTKDEVEKCMLPKLETTIQCPLSDMQLFWYKRLLLRESSLLKALEDEHGALSGASGTDWKKLSSLLMQLRKCCNHPFLFPNVEPSAEESYFNQLVNGSGKFEVLRRLLAKLHSNGHRVVLFSQFTSTLDLLEDFLTHEQYKYCRLDGGTNRVQRTVDINSFNMVGSSKFVFLMSTRAGGLGINCQTADTCILFDSDWNPQVDMQAMARVHRIGQTKKVRPRRSSLLGRTRRAPAWALRPAASVRTRM
jgi:SWI/SNF-related matrix-associated actin-dependent regulator of chromatin subfamily A member 5